jgi:hypothetical protein
MRGFAVGRGAAALEARSCGDLDESLAGAAAAARAHGGRRIRAWLSGALCPALLVATIEGVQSQEERVAVVRSTAAKASGAGVEMWVDDSPLDAATVAASLASHTLDQLTASFAGLDLVSIRPYWSAVLERVAADGKGCDAISIEEGDSATILAMTGGIYSAATTLHPILDAASSRAAIARASARIEFREGLFRHFRVGLASAGTRGDSKIPLGALTSEADRS